MLYSVKPFFSELFVWTIGGLRMNGNYFIVSEEASQILECVYENEIVGWKSLIVDERQRSFKIVREGATIGNFTVYIEPNEDSWVERVMKTSARREYLEGVAWLKEQKYKDSLSPTDVKKLMGQIIKQIPDGIDDVFKSQLVSLWRTRYMKAILRDLSQNNGTSEFINELKKNV